MQGSRGQRAARRSRKATRGSSSLRELASAPVAHGAPDRARVEAPLEQLLTELALSGKPEEQPCQRSEGDERALDHHHRAGKALVVQRRDSPLPRGVLVDAVERTAR